MARLDTHEVSVSSKGQISLPVELRHALDIRSGDRLVLQAQPDGSIRLCRRNVAEFESLIGRWRETADQSLDVDGILDNLRGTVAE